jgi:hypothetical protein
MRREAVQLTRGTVRTDHPRSYLSRLPIHFLVSWVESKRQGIDLPWQWRA